MSGMDKRYWKDRAKEAEARAQAAQTRVRILESEARELRYEVEDKRKNWAPIKIKHPYTPRDAACMLCDDPAEDPRHGSSAA
jgi:hypothetical protein